MSISPCHAGYVCVGQVPMLWHPTLPQRHGCTVRSTAKDVEERLKDTGMCFPSCQSVSGKGSAILFGFFHLLCKAFGTKPYWIGSLSLGASVFPKWASILFATAGATRLVVRGCCSFPVTRRSEPHHSSAHRLCSQPREVPMPGEEISIRKSYPMQWPCQVWKKKNLLPPVHRLAAETSKAASQLRKQNSHSWVLWKIKVKETETMKTKAQPLEITTKQTERPTKRHPPFFHFPNT